MKAKQRKMGQSLRQDRRRFATFQLKNGLNIRRSITPSELAGFVLDIERSNVSAFGIVKLANLELDTLYKHPHRDEYSTMVRFAAHMGRDAIVSSLLVAGADPTVFGCRCSRGATTGAGDRDTHDDHDDDDDTDLDIEEEEGEETVPPDVDNGANLLVSALVTPRISKVPKPLAVYFVRRLVEMKRVHGKLPPEPQHLRCQACTESIPDDAEQCRGPCRLLALEPCAHGHVVCEACYWLHAVVWEDRDDGVADIVCPVCVPPRARDERAVSSSSTPTTTMNVCPQVAAESRARYLLLPANAEEVTGRTKRFHFQNMTRDQVARVLLGTKRDQRDDELRKAAASGSRRRLLALVEAGVDLEARNEYGQTAVFIAAWRGHAAAVAYLASCGANVRHRDNAGVSVLAAAESSGSPAVADVVRAALASAPTATATPDGGEAEARAGADADTDEAVEQLTRSLQRGLALSHTDNATAAADAAFTVTTLIGADVPHQGAGSVVIDGAFSDAFLDGLLALFPRLPVAPKERGATECASRSYYCDASAHVVRVLSAVMRRLEARGDGVVSATTKKVVTEVLPHMRFLDYDKVGGSSPPHTDLCRATLDGRSSTHTFILYLTDCANGGATNMLRCVSQKKSAVAAGDNNVLAVVTPRRGRLLVFPHVCPHEGEKVIDVPKILLRGEMI